MNLKKSVLLALSLGALLVVGCAASRPNIAVEKSSASPGGSITRGGQSAKLLGKPIAVGDSLALGRLG